MVFCPISLMLEIAAVQPLDCSSSDKSYAKKCSSLTSLIWPYLCQHCSHVVFLVFLMIDTLMEWFEQIGDILCTLYLHSVNARQALKFLYISKSCAQTLHERSYICDGIAVLGQILIMFFELCSRKDDGFQEMYQSASIYKDYFMYMFGLHKRYFEITS